MSRRRSPFRRLLPSAPALAIALALTLAALMALPGTAAAQGFSGLTGSGGGALEIQAEDGIAWRRQEQVYVARGNAVAKRGDLTVRAETLTAHYREAEGGGDTEIYRIVAEGDVELVTPRETATGDRGVYDLDKAVMVLTGRDLRLVTGTEEVTAEDSLEYWEDRNLAVARGNAVARNEMAGGGTRRVSANILTAYFQDAAAPDDAAADDGNGAARADLDRIEAFENVQIASPNTFARGDKAVYVTRMQTATLVGDVRISRGENQLNGGYAEVNLETGVSRLLGAPPDSDARARVRGLLKPRADGLNGAPAQ